MSTGPQSSLTILFEAPFWIGLYERTDNGKYEVCKITFGSEPKDYEVYEFLLKNWHKLKFSPPIQAEVVIERKSILNVCSAKFKANCRIKALEQRRSRR